MIVAQIRGQKASVKPLKHSQRLLVLFLLKAQAAYQGWCWDLVWLLLTTTRKKTGTSQSWGGALQRGLTAYQTLLKKEDLALLPLRNPAFNYKVAFCSHSGWGCPEVGEPTAWTSLLQDIHAPPCSLLPWSCLEEVKVRVVSPHKQALPIQHLGCITARLSRSL